MAKLCKVISGGQTGADQAGLRAAKASGLETGGWMSSGFLTEDRQRPEFAQLYGIQSTLDVGLQISAAYRKRSRINVEDSDATIYFTYKPSRASNNAASDCADYKKLFLPIILEDRGCDPPLYRIVGDGAEDFLVAWIIANSIGTLNVAGNRESKAPGIGKFIEKFLTRVFRGVMEQQRGQ